MQIELIHVISAIVKMLAIVIAATVVATIAQHYVEYFCKKKVYKRKVKLYLALNRALRCDSYIPALIFENGGKLIDEEVDKIAGGSIFIYNLEKEIIKSKVYFIAKYYRLNEKEKVFEQEVEKLRNSLKK